MASMTISENSSTLTWAHVGDLHITAEHEANYRDFQSIIDSMNTHLAGRVDFCVLPGDNADDGSADQYYLIRRALKRLKIPVHVIPGDHDRKPGNLDAFYQGLKIAPLPNATTVAGHRCLFLDVVSQGSGGPDFALGQEQVEWLKSQLQSALRENLASVVFMHAYPADLNRDGTVLKQLLREYRVAVVDMGHTHYNELANDGTTIFATTRSTGQVEEGPVGFSLASLNHGVVSWRFKPLRSLWPFVMITSPADHRLVTDVGRPGHGVAGQFRVTARVFGASRVYDCRCRLDEGPWLELHLDGADWQGLLEAPPQPFTLTVEATDIAGTSATDTIVVATPGYQPPQRMADGSDADALRAWPERHLLGTRLGPNRNGRQW
jgi:3',5'-cyclic-AMP phosphodiesterase